MLLMKGLRGARYGILNPRKRQNLTQKLQNLMYKCQSLTEITQIHKRSMAHPTKIDKTLKKLRAIFTGRKLIFVKKVVGHVIHFNVKYTPLAGVNSIGSISLLKKS